MRKKTTSQRIALGVLAMDSVATAAVLALCCMAIRYGFEGTLPYLTALIGALQAVTAIVLSSYFHKSAKENCVGGIVYDCALAEKMKETEQNESEVDVV